MGPAVLSNSAEKFAFLTQAFWATDVAAAALKVGVLDRLDSGPVTPEEVGSDLGIDEERGRLLLTALVGVGLAARSDAGFSAVVPGLSEIVTRLSENTRLVDVLTGQSLGVSAESVAGAAHLYPRMVRYLASGFQDSAAIAATKLARPGLRVLDLGCGAAPWSLAVVSKHRDVRVVAVDLPEVIPVTRSAIAEAEFEEHFEFRGGDMFDIAIEPGHYDLVIAGGICHLFDELTNRRLLGLASRALAPEGKLAIFEPLINEDLEGPRSVILYALDLSTRTVGGGVRPFSAYVPWLKASGLRDIERTDLMQNPPMSLITANNAKKKGDHK